MVEGLNCENYVSLFNENSGFGVNIGLEIKGDIENSLSIDMLVLMMEIGLFVSVDVDKLMDNLSVIIVNNINEGLWLKEVECDDLLFYDSDND